MTWVKLCGMTRRTDVDAAIDAGTDALGFVVAAASPRRVDPEVVSALVEGVGVSTFLVSVDAEPAWLVAAAKSAGVTGIQPHGEHSASAVAAALDAGLEVLVPVAVGDELPDLSSIPRRARPILDTRVAGAHGGTGVAFDWSLAAGIDREFVLAGGLRPDNVNEAIRRTGAWGVDAASGVETAPGIKDHDAMRRFVLAARAGARR